MPHFLFSPVWSAYGSAAQLITTIFVKYMKSNVLSSSVGGIKLAKLSTWHSPDISQWSHQANATAFVIRSTVIENHHFSSSSGKPETFNIFRTTKKKLIFTKHKKGHNRGVLFLSELHMRKEDSKTIKVNPKLLQKH